MIELGITSCIAGSFMSASELLQGQVGGYTPTRRLRPRKTHYPAPHRRGWHDLDDEADDLLTSNGVRLYHAEMALIWGQGYHILDAKEALRLSILARYAEEIASRKAFGTEVSATKSAASA